MFGVGVKNAYASVLLSFHKCNWLLFRLRRREKTVFSRRNVPIEYKKRRVTMQLHSTTIILSSFGVFFLANAIEPEWQEPNWVVENLVDPAGSQVQFYALSQAKIYFSFRTFAVRYSRRTEQNHHTQFHRHKGRFKCRHCSLLCVLS